MLGSDFDMKQALERDLKAGCEGLVASSWPELERVKYWSRFLVHIAIIGRLSDMVEGMCSGQSCGFTGARRCP